MPQLTTYHLHFHSGLHRGANALGIEDGAIDVPSDTLFAALTSTWRHAGGDVERWCEAFASDPPLLLTSAFPFAGGVRFFPLPVRLDTLFSAETLRNRAKQLKSIRYLSEQLLHKLLRGASLDAELFPEREYCEPSDQARGLALQGGALWLTQDEFASLPDKLTKEVRQGHNQFALRRRAVWAEDRLPRVTVDRTSSASTYFQIGRTTYAPDCGLWFGVQWHLPQQPLADTTVQAAFEQSLALLQDAGLGGERSAGYGAFRLEPSDAIRLPDANDGDAAYLLSRYHPTPAEISAAALSGPHSAYRIETIGGYLHSPDGTAQMRRPIRMLAPGSVVHLPTTPAGDLQDVRPYYNSEMHYPHPVYRYGYGLGARIQEANNG